MKKLKLSFFALTVIISGLFVRPVWALTQPAQLYVVQVQISGGKNNSNQDYVVLFNPNDFKVNLKGYRLVKRAQNSLSDSNVKVWDIDAFVEPKSFYMWANSGYSGTDPKPDVKSSATLSNDNGLALRYGSSSTNAVIDSLAWGKANNGYKVVTEINPGPNLALFRQNWYAITSDYYIASPKPYNSLTTDFLGAYPQYATTSQPNIPGSKPSGSTGHTPSPGTAQNQAFGTNTAATSGTPYLPQNPNSTKPGNYYLILSGSAALALIYLAYRFIVQKK